ncbi:helix-turn-helix domain-containing protein [Aquimarina algicola]|uniref:Helix-turn-helix domain-containing protein n=1 Tax=Aquimarina algicola TaxID=2589995 RepID=A0A504J2U7_9FLAO|nr:AraC family transcriptional regulator [Aquimarina algicola]TPN85256.1 helix-turn-helix domain-containing protein [Aquimarina algicola]
MREFKFDKQKYGFELDMDLHTLDKRPSNYFESEVHVTDFFEVIFLKQSSGNISVKDFGASLLPYTIICNSPYQKKTNNINQPQGYHLVFKDDFLANFFLDKLFVFKLNFFYNATSPQFFQIHEKEFTAIEDVLKNIIAEINDFRNDSQHIIRALLYFVLTKLNRLYSEFYKLYTIPSGDNIAYIFKDALEKNIRQVHQVEEYANLLKVERNRLNKIIQRHYNLTPKKLIQHRLLQEIKTELLYTDKTISEIASELHFSEPNNLSRFFQKHEEISPLHFRQNRKRI